MQKNLAQTLAQIHAEFGIYDRDIFSVADAQNIYLPHIINPRTCLPLPILHRLPV